MHFVTYMTRHTRNSRNFQEQNELSLGLLSFLVDQEINSLISLIINMLPITLDHIYLTAACSIFRGSEMEFAGLL